MNLAWCMSLHEDRIAVLIGKKGSVKSLLERICMVSISIDSETGRYEITIPDKVDSSVPQKGTDKIAIDLENEEDTEFDDEDEDSELFDETAQLSDEEDEEDLKFGYDSVSMKNLKFNLESPEVLELQKTEDSYRIFITRRIIDAINYGFNPNKALKIIYPNVNLEVIDLEDKVGTSQKKLKRYKGRLIGENGKMRDFIEHYAGVHMSIFRKYLALIGQPDKMMVAKKAVSMILTGSPHKTVISYLQTIYQKEKQDEIKENWKPVF